MSANSLSPHLSIPMIWDDRFLSEIDLRSVGEVYGKLADDFIGGGRASFSLGKVAPKKAARLINEVQRRGITFNYLLNATCCDNLETTRDGQRRIRSLLDWIASTGASKVTLALPQLVELVKRHYPSLAVSVSTNAMVDNLERVRSWEELGVDQITLSYVDVNRDFEELRRMAKHARCRLQLICNLLCRRHCPFVSFHANFHSHASQSRHVNNLSPIEYYTLFCMEKNFADPRNLFKSNWIRPEDLGLYEDAGIRFFKLAERGIQLPHLARIVKAYSERRYDGNFIDLFPSMRKYDYIARPRAAHYARFWRTLTKLQPGFLRKNIPDLLHIGREGSFGENYGLSIPNRLLDGFAERFSHASCRNLVCETCGYCDEWAERVVKLDSSDGSRQAALSTFRNLRKGLSSSETYRRF